MKKFLGIFSALLLVMVWVSSSDATPITFIDTTFFNPTGTNPLEDYVRHGRGTVNKLDGILDYVTWIHHFDFVPPAEEVTAGKLTVWLKDDAEDPWWFPCEYAFGWAEDGTWDLGEVDTGDYSYNVTASYLEDGKFQIVLGSLGGDFYIDRSDLKVTYNPVPEPGTLLLLGSGLLGLAGYGFKRKKKK